MFKTTFRRLIAGLGLIASGAGVALAGPADTAPVTMTFLPEDGFIGTYDDGSFAASTVVTLDSLQITAASFTQDTQVANVFGNTSSGNPDYCGVLTLGNTIGTQTFSVCLVWASPDGRDTGTIGFARDPADKAYGSASYVYAGIDGVPDGGIANSGFVSDGLYDVGASPVFGFAVSANAAGVHDLDTVQGAADPAAALVALNAAFLASITPGITGPASFLYPSESAATLADYTASEDGDTGQVLVALATAPAAEVRVEMYNYTNTACSYLPGTLQFDATNWNVPQVVTVSAADDSVAEGGHYCGPVAVAFSMGDPDYNSRTLGFSIVIITDNDVAVPGISTVASATIGTETVTTSTAAVEGGAAAQVLLVLDAAPTGDVVATFSNVTGTGCSFAPATATFTTADWNAPQLVTITATDDSLDEGAHACDLQVDLASADADYDQMSDSFGPVAITDDDAPPGISAAASALVDAVLVLADDTASEAGETAMIPVVLDSPPAGSVYLDLADTGGTVCSVLPSLLEFTAANWNVPQAVTVTAVDDSGDEGDHSCTIEAAVSAITTDPSYGNITKTFAPITITDNDAILPALSTVASATIDTETVTADDQATEGGDTGEVLFVLATAPTHTVGVSLTNVVDENCSFSPDLLIFLASNWDQPQRVTVIATNDDVAEGATSCNPLATTVSDDPDYMLLTNSFGPFTITDNDTAGVTLLQTDGATPPATAIATASEDGDQALVLFQLSSRPMADVTLAYSVAGGVGCSAPAGPVTITPAEWDVPQRVVISAADDSAIEGAHACDIQITYDSADPIYDALGTALLQTVSITDNDFAPGIATPASGTVGGNPVTADLAATEGGGTAQVLIALTTEPDSSVIVDIQNISGDDCSYAQSSISFTAVNWFVPQLVIITATDDGVVEGAHACTPMVSLVLGDAEYNDLTFPLDAVTITDNDSVGLADLVSATIGNTLVTRQDSATEGGADGVLLLALTSRPTSAVTLEIVDQSGGQCSYAPLTATFDPLTWDTPQQFTITAVDDGYIESESACSVVVDILSDDANYSAARSPVGAITLTDNDVPGVVATDFAYIGDVPVDADLVANEGPAGTQNNTGMVLFSLSAVPEQGLTVTISDQSGTESAFSPSEFLFDASVWSQPGVVFVTATNDAVAEGVHSCTPVATFSSENPDWQLEPLALSTVTIKDDDTAGVSILVPDNQATEGNMYETASVLITLATRPAADVTVTMTNDTGTQCSYAPSEFVITPEDYQTASLVIVSATGDDIAEGEHSCMPVVSFETEDTFYQLTEEELSPESLTALTITDNDTAGYVADQFGDAAGLGAVFVLYAIHEGGYDDLLLFRLSSEPADPVQVAFADAEDGQCTFSPATMTFDGTNWNRPQAVTVSAVDDQRADGGPNCTPVATFSSLDESYQLSDATLAAYTVYDNDNAGYVAPASGFVVGQGDLTVSYDVVEGGQTDRLLVGLTSEPTQPVEVTLTDVEGGQCGFSPAKLEFDATNWAQVQAVTVSAVDDLQAEGGHACTPVATFSSQDEYYQLSDATLTAYTVRDNDTGGLVMPAQTQGPDGLILADATAGEDGDTATVLLALQSEPTADVYLDFTNADVGACTFSTNPMIFTADNWAEPQVLTVGVPDDSVVEDDSTCGLGVWVTSSDPSYVVLAAPLIVITVTDDDVAEANLPESATIDGQTIVTDLTTTEDGKPATILMVLNSQPAADVVIAFSNASQPVARTRGALSIPEVGQCSYVPQTVAFTAGNWNQPQAVNVIAVDDSEIEGGHVCLPVAFFSSDDPDYDIGAVSLAPITILDNDSIGLAITDQDLAATEGAEDVAAMSIALTSQPTAVVTLSFADNDQCTASPATVTLTPETYALPQRITFAAIDDDLAEGAHACQPRVLITSEDPRHDGLVAAIPLIAIADNPADRAGAPLSALLQADLEQTVARQSTTFRTIARGALDRLTDSSQETGCGTTDQAGVDGVARADGDGVQVDGSFASESFDCVTGQRRLVRGDLTITDTDDLGARAMVTFSQARETETDDRVQGWFWGGYGMQSDLNGQGTTGTTTGFGLHGGIFGARRLQDGLFADHYAAVAAGQHRFDADLGDGLLASGDYSWAGLFAGAALSGRQTYGLFTLEPRAGFDLGFAQASDPALSVREPDWDQLGSITLDPVTGLRLYLEAGFVFGADQGAEASLPGQYAITPRLLCESGFGTDSLSCGYGLGFSLEQADLLAGTSWTLELDHESREGGTSTTLQTVHERAILRGAGTMTSALGITASGAPMLSQGVAIQW